MIYRYRLLPYRYRYIYIYYIAIQPFLKPLPAQARKAYSRLSSNAQFIKKILGNPTRHFLMVGFLNAINNAYA